MQSVTIGPLDVGPTLYVDYRSTVNYVLVDSKRTHVPRQLSYIRLEDHDYPNAVSLIFMRPRDDDNDGDDDDDRDDDGVGDEREIRMMRRMRRIRMLPAERAARMAATAVMMRKR